MSGLVELIEANMIEPLQKWQRDMIERLEQERPEVLVVSLDRTALIGRTGDVVVIDDSWAIVDGPRAPEPGPIEIHFKEERVLDLPRLPRDNRDNGHPKRWRP